MSLDDFLQLLMKMLYVTAPFGFMSLLILLFCTPWLVEQDQGGFKGFCWMVLIMVLTILAGAWVGTIGLALIVWLMKLAVNYSIEWWAVFKSI